MRNWDFQSHVKVPEDWFIMIISTHPGEKNMLVLIIGLVVIYSCFGKRTRNKICKSLLKLLTLTFKIPMSLLKLVVGRKGR